MIPDEYGPIYHVSVIKSLDKMFVNWTSCNFCSALINKRNNSHFCPKDEGHHVNCQACRKPKLQNGFISAEQKKRYCDFSGTKSFKCPKCRIECGSQECKDHHYAQFCKDTFQCGKVRKIFRKTTYPKNLFLFFM